MSSGKNDSCHQVRMVHVIGKEWSMTSGKNDSCLERKRTHVTD